MSSLLLLIVAFFITFLDTLKGNTITSCSSSNTCTCQSGEACIIDCDGVQICDFATINAGSATSVTIDCIDFRACRGTTFNIGNVPLAGGITCSGSDACRQTIFNAGNHGSQFDITCSAAGSQSCLFAEINAGNASSVTMYCNSDFGCYQADINCGVGSGACNIHCNERRACENVDLICNTASDCTLRCDYGHDDSCLDLVKFDCGTSVCSMYCDESLDACANGNNIYPDVTDAISFKCIGVGCTANFINSSFTQPKCSAEDETCPKCTCVNDCVHDLGPDGAYQIIRMVSDTEECCHICKKTKDCSSWMYLTSTSGGIEDECYLSGDCFLYQQKFQECDTINIQHGKYISGSVFDKKCVDNDDCCEGDICDINKGKCKKNSESLSSSSSSSSSDKFIAIGDIINMDNERNKVSNYKTEPEDKIIELSLSSSTYTIIFIICFVVLICTIIWRIFAFVIFK